MSENICPTCKGTGDPYNHEREWIRCATCEGSGRATECEHCGGSGWDKSNVHHEDWTECLHCEGNGYIPILD